jgi:transposase
LQAAQWLVDGDVLVLDNAQTHHEIEQDLRALLREAGITLLFLPKYSAEFNPIELVWSKIKYAIRKLGKRTQEEAIASLKVAVGQVTLENVKNYFEHCGYFD